MSSFRRGDGARTHHLHDPSPEIMFRYIYTFLVIFLLFQFAPNLVMLGMAIALCAYLLYALYRLVVEPLLDTLNKD